MARTKKLPPQNAEDVDLAKQTITGAFTATVEEHRAALAKAEEEVLRLQRQIIAAETRRAAWTERGEITEDTAFDAHSFATRDMHDLARRVTSPSVRLDPGEVDAARRKHEVVDRYLADRNWRPSRS